MNQLSALKAGLYGVAVADALGQPTQFHPAGQTITHMLSRSKNIPAGSWSDDTSLTLATIAALAVPTNDVLTETMQYFSAWLNHTAFTPTNITFDIGAGTEIAIDKFNRTHDPLTAANTTAANNGNGALMRMLPVGLLAVQTAGYRPLQMPAVLKLSCQFAQLTHGHPRSTVACFIYIALLGRLQDPSAAFDITTLQEATHDAFAAVAMNPALTNECHYYTALTTDAFYQQSAANLSTSGYVVDTLLTCWWLLANCATYEAVVTTAIRLGGDTDTIASIAGGLVAVRDGFASIPDTWLAELQDKTQLTYWLKKAANSANFK
ncbi:ADP-ribosylglycohydrolase family protein [Furfurilactobacillus siliginis]|uniref:ADP-ribosylglycohydrolase family protein n=1 Tax=Furfurilactobacillus siliginis TaxID=348151 RepID=A0A0R2KZG3_9LACO|nr:ADP-ribosylglycohydrolase family protein [Furfurilactobacillus siliginis]KRN94883.1 ADP-ribosylglycohydrolase family protein [Furfurilactobacillus siliginis]GEK28455.1 hypothetical protein LSI01_07660 [Furfurilactobacillus siliginis]